SHSEFAIRTPYRHRVRLPDNVRCALAAPAATPARPPTRYAKISFAYLSCTFSASFCPRLAPAGTGCFFGPHLCVDYHGPCFGRHLARWFEITVAAIVETHTAPPKNCERLAAAASRFRISCNSLVVGGSSMVRNLRPLPVSAFRCALHRATRMVASDS